ncbi:MAG: hypothetical protein WDW38_002937 [Sanguina aurantia]
MCRLDPRQALGGGSSGGSTAAAAAAAAALQPAPSVECAELRALLAGTQRGLLVVGELTDPRDVVVVMQVAVSLGWPVATDVLSGLRLGLGASTTKSGAGCASLMLHHVDHLLLGDKRTWAELQPEVILQIGGHLTSKRLGQFMEWAAMGQDNGSSLAGGRCLKASWVFVADQPLRFDPAHLVTHRAVMPLSSFLESVVLPSCTDRWQQQQSRQAQRQHQQFQPPLHQHHQHQQQQQQQQLLDTRANAQRHSIGAPHAQQQRQQQPHNSSSHHPPSSSQTHGRQQDPSSQPHSGGQPDAGVVTAYGELLIQLDTAVGQEIDVAMEAVESLSEPFVARCLARLLPAGHGLFIGNSMPIRDMDMYASGRASVRSQQQDQNADPGAPSYGGGSGSSSSYIAAASAFPATASYGGPRVGTAVAANRGASGIDGVLSTAAGFAEGLVRPCTLLVGDLSFLHDINGLNLLRTGESRQPLTVVLINNGGGGIFSFLPIAGALSQDTFTPLWATPQNVDLEGMCRAHGIPHQRVATAADLPSCLASAWALNRHVVVEVTTQRSTNVQIHRTIQASVLQAFQKAHASLVDTSPSAHHQHASHSMALDRASHSMASGHASNGASNGTGPHGDTRAAASDSTFIERAESAGGVSRAAVSGGVPSAATRQLVNGRGEGSRLRPEVHVRDLTWGRFSLPLLQPLTAAAAGRDGSGHGVREGFIVHVTLAGADGSVWSGSGEVSPLPGLHRESLEDAEQQLCLLASIAGGVAVPHTLPLLGGRVSHWLQHTLGLRTEGWLVPSVRFGLESALLSALADCHGSSMTQLLASSPSPSPSSHQSPPQSAPAPAPAPTPAPEQQQQQQQLAESSSSPEGPIPSAAALGVTVGGTMWSGLATSSMDGMSRIQQGVQGAAVSINALVDNAGDHVSVEHVVHAAVLLAAQGFSTLKVKVGRRSSPLEDARVLNQIRAAVGGSVVLRADANQRWSLEQAVEFGLNVALAGLEYVEEPTRDPWDMPAFFQATGIRVAVDESLDAGLLSIPGFAPPSRNHAHAHAHPASQTSPSTAPSPSQTTSPPISSWPPPRTSTSPPPTLAMTPASGLAAVVIKPSALGGVEAAMCVAGWAVRQGLTPVLSSCFESSVGMSVLVQMAAAIESSAQPRIRRLPPAPSALATSPAVMSHPGSSGGGDGTDGFGNMLFSLQAPVEAAGVSQVPQHRTSHGLGTLPWFATDSVPNPLQPVSICQRPQAGGTDSDGGSSDVALSAEAAHSLLSSCRPSEPLLRPAGTDPRSASGVGSGPRSASEAAAVTDASPSPPQFPPSATSLDGDSSSSSRQGNTPHPFHQSSPASVMPSPELGIQQGAQPRLHTYVFLHGFLGGAEDWLPIMHCLSLAGHRCMAFDLPGHMGSSVGPLTAAASRAAHSSGTSGQGRHSSSSSNGGSSNGSGSSGSGAGGHPDTTRSSAGTRVEQGRACEGYQMAACVEALGVLLSEAGLQHVILVGYSLGARIALQLAVAKPELLASVALISGTAGIKAPVWADLPAMRVPALLLAGNLDSKFMDINMRMFKRMTGCEAQVSPTPTPLTQPLPLDRGEAAGPGMSMDGDAERVGGAGSVAEQLNGLGHAFVSIPGAGHALHLEAPEHLTVHLLGLAAALETKRYY